MRATRKALNRRNYVLHEMENNGYITHDQYLSAASAPLGTIRYGSNAKFREMGGYFMEEVRRDLMKKFGETAENGPNSVYAGGLWVRTSMIPYMQDAAAESLREGLAKFDGGRGWRDLGLSIDVSGDWRGPLDRAQVGTGFPDWRKAVVLEKRRSALIGFTTGHWNLAGLRFAAPAPGRRQRFSYFRTAWCHSHKKVSGEAMRFAHPEVSGGRSPRKAHGGAGDEGRFEAIGASYNRATQALASPVGFKQWLRDCAQTGMTPASSSSMAFCVWKGRLGKNAVNFDRVQAQDDAVGGGQSAPEDIRRARSGMRRSQNRRKLGVGISPTIFRRARRRDHRAQADNAYAILATRGVRSGRR